MKLIAVLFLCGLLQVHARGVAQKITYKNTTSKSLVYVLNAIQKQTSYSFFYDNEAVNGLMVEKVDFQNADLHEVLDKLLFPRHLEYNFQGRTIFITAQSHIARQHHANVDLATPPPTKISGVVTDSTGAPLSGVSVNEKGTGNATLTGSKGEFELSIKNPGTSILVFSLVGYFTEEQPVNGRNTLVVNLRIQQRQMAEVVVTALGIRRNEAALGYSVQRVQGSALQNVKGVDVGTSLTGHVSGLVVKNSTEFDAAPTFSLRGETPLLVINGVPYGNIDFRDIPADDIESIDVLKGPTAAALYGYKGAAGAIMITTKKGKNEGLDIQVNSSNMFDLGFVALPKVQTQYAHGIDGNISNDYVWGPKLDIGDSAVMWSPKDKKTEKLPLVSAGKNNLKNFMQTGLVSNNSISLTQTGKNGFFKAGLNYIYQKGIWPNNTLKIINYTMSGDLHVGKHFDLKSDMGYTRQTSPQTWGSGYGGHGYLYQILMWTGPEYDVRDYRDYWIKPNVSQNWGYTAFYDNPYLIAYEKPVAVTINKLYASATATYNFTPDLNLMFRTGYDFVSNELTVRNPPGIHSSDGNIFPASFGPSSFTWGWGTNGMYGDENAWDYSTNNDLILTYKKKINRFTVDLLGGASLYYYNNKDQGAKTVYGINVPGWYSLANAAASTVVGSNSIAVTYGNSHSQVNSLYGKASFSYDELAYLDLTARNDWSSTQKASERSYMYPSAALSVMLSRIVDLPSVFDMLKIRGAWTQDKTPADVYADNRNYSSGSVLGFVTSDYPANLLGADLRPSSTRTWEVGTAAAFFKNRLNIDVAYFNKYAFNTQTSASISNASGFTSSLVNTNETRVRKGLEISLGGYPINHRKFKWNSIVNYSFDHQYYVNLDHSFTPDEPWIKKGARVDAYTVNRNIRNADGELVNNAGRPMKSAYLSKYGNTDPNFSFGFINQFSVGSFMFNINIDGRIGGTLYDYIWDKMFDTGANPETVTQYRYDEVVNKRITYVGPGVKIVSGDVTYDKYGNILNDTRKYAKNDVPISWQSYERSNTGAEHGGLNKSFAKLREVSIGYNIPPRLLTRSGIKSASVSVIGQNLLLLTKFKFSDPDVDTENLNAPSQRIVGVNVKLGL